MPPKEIILPRVSQKDLEELEDIFGVPADEMDTFYTDAALVEGLSFGLASYGEEADIDDFKALNDVLNVAIELPTTFRKKKKKIRTMAGHLTADSILATAGYADNLVVHEAMSALHPDLLLLIDEQFIPGEGQTMYDMSCEANVNRNLFLQNVRNVAREKPPSAVVIQSEDKFSYVDPKGCVLATGGALDVFKYAVETDIENAYNTYNRLCKHSPEIKKDLEGIGGYQHLLRMFRQQRTLAKSLDKLSKVSQLSRSDKDASYYWFDDLHLDHLILHPSLPLQVKARYQHCEVCPLEDLKQLPEGAAYVVDVTRGGVEGASGNDKSLLRDLVSSVSSFYMHAFLGPELIGLKIVLINKPRPHNHTGVFYYEQELEPFMMEDLESILADVATANHKRNERLYGVFQSKRINPMPPHNLILDMVTYMDRLWQAADDVAVVRAAMREKKKKPTKHVDAVYEEFVELFKQKELPPYKFMKATGGMFTKISKPLRLFVVEGISKEILYNMIMTETETKRSYHLGEWWYLDAKKIKGKGVKMVRGVEEKVYKDI